MSNGQNRWSRQVEFKRLWEYRDQTGTRLPITTLRLKTASALLLDVLGRPPLDVLTSRQSQADELSAEEVDALALFGLSSELKRRPRREVDGLYLENITIERWLKKSLWLEPLDPDYPETLRRFAKYLAESLNRVNVVIGQWPHKRAKPDPYDALGSEPVGDDSLWEELSFEPEFRCPPPTWNSQRSIFQPLKRNQTLSTHRVREILRHTLQMGNSRDKAATALGLSKGVISKYTALAKGREITGKMLDRLSDKQLHQALHGPRPQVSMLVEPDFGLLYRQRLDSGITKKAQWEQYRRDHKDHATYNLSRFYDLYKLWIERLPPTRKT